MDKRIIDLLGTIHAEASFLLLSGKEYCGDDFVLETCAGCSCFFACESITRGNRLLSELRSEAKGKKLSLDKVSYEAKTQNLIDWARSAVLQIAESGGSAEDRQRALDCMADISSLEPFIKNAWALSVIMEKMIDEYTIILEILDRKIPQWRDHFNFDRTAKDAKALLRKVIE